MRATTILILTSYATLSTAIRILCVGETLFDGLPTGIFLSGAPLNAAVHLLDSVSKLMLPASATTGSVARRDDD